MAGIQLLQNLCGVTEVEAEAMLESADGDVDMAAAVALSQREFRSPMQQLRELIGGAASDTALQQYLFQAGGDVDAAAGRYFDSLPSVASGACTRLGSPWMTHCRHAY
jgi:hypothetical protein